jgi:hypothetical protein
MLAKSAAEYKPYYIASIKGCLDARSPRLQAFGRNDTIGNSYFEGGTIPASLAAMRLDIARSLAASGMADDGMLIVQAPEHFSSLAALRGPYKGLRLHVLISKERYAQYGESLWEQLALMAEDKVQLEEASNLSHNFSDSSFTRCYYGSENVLQSGLFFEAWHDIRNHLFFSFSEAYLKVVLATLTRNFDLEANGLAQYFKMGDSISGVKAGKNTVDRSFDVSAHDWEVVDGKVVGISDTFVTIKHFKRTHRLPWYLVTTPANNLNVSEAAIERLSNEVRRLPRCY